MRIKPLSLLLWILVSVVVLRAEIRRHPTGVNVNTNGATTVFITFGNLRQQIPAEAFWCGELIPATPDIGFKCRPGTIFGRLPLRFDQSRSSGQGGFTDIMSIPPSVARRAYQAAQRGETSSFFYVRRFVSTAGGPDEYVFVTCRLAGGGARVPLALLDVRLAFSGNPQVLFVAPGEQPPPFSAELTYNGTGRLKGRWEVVLPGEEPPRAEDLLTEATLPVELRGTQRRFTEIQRFNVFLPPVGNYTLPGPDPAQLPTAVEGLYLILLRIEASDDKEGDSDLRAAGAGPGVVHSGAVAGFPLPPLRYLVGKGSPRLSPGGKDLVLLLPADHALVAPDQELEFSWVPSQGAALHRLEVQQTDGTPVLSALLQPVVGTYRCPPWLREKASGLRILRWRVVALGPEGEELEATPWRTIRLESVPRN